MNECVGSGLFKSEAHIYSFMHLTLDVAVGTNALCFLSVATHYITR